MGWHGMAWDILLLVLGVSVSVEVGNGDFFGGIVSVSVKPLRQVYVRVPLTGFQWALECAGRACVRCVLMCALFVCNYVCAVCVCVCVCVPECVRA